MKEEKRRSQKTILSQSKKNIQEPSDSKIFIQNELQKRGVISNGSKHIILNKHVRRIGYKSRVKAYNTIVDQSIYKQLNQSKQSEMFKDRKIENTEQKQQNKRRLKRIGHKKMINAYRQIIIDLQKIKIQKKEQKNSQKCVSDVKIFGQPFNDQQITILDEQNQIQNKIIDESSEKTNKQNITAEQQTPFVENTCIRKVTSGLGDENVNGDSFSININMVSNTSEDASREMKLQTASIFEKSDQCLESFKSESDQRVSQSVIINGSFERLINESQINTSTSFDQDEGQMKELVEQINKNLQINQKKQQNKTQEQLFKEQPRKNHLLVPNSKKTEPRISKDNKKNNNGRQEQRQKLNRKVLSIQEKKQNVQVNTLQTKINALKVKQSEKQLPQKSQQQKLLQIIEEKHNKTHKNDFRRNSKNKKSTALRGTSKQKNKSYINQEIINIKDQSKKRKSKQVKVQDRNRVINKVKEQKENQTTNKDVQHNKKPKKKPLPQAFPERMLITQNPKRPILEIRNDQNLIKSNIIFPISKPLIDSKVQIINPIKIKQDTNGIMTSLHQKIKVQSNHHKQMILSKYSKKTNKNISDFTSQPTTSNHKRNKNKLQVNKYVNQARKLLTNSVHI